MSNSPVYQSSPEREPSDAYLPGEVRFLVVGNRARLLDARRTPVTVTNLDIADRAFTVRIDAFEDVGASWELGLDRIRQFEFPAGSSFVCPEPGGSRRSVLCH